MIRDSGYWDVRDDVAEQLFAPLLRQFGAESAHDLDVMEAQAQREGNTGLVQRIRVIIRRIDSITSDRRTVLRRRNGALDAALLRLGHATVAITAQRR